MKREAVFFVSVSVIFVFLTSVFLSPGFNSWEKKGVGTHYIENSFESTGAANLVSSVVWDFRSFDTLGEETVLFTAAVGVFTLFMFGTRREGD